MNSAVRDFQELYQSNHGMAGNHETDGFVNSAVRDFQELYQSNHGTAGNHETGGFVNSSVNAKVHTRISFSGLFDHQKTLSLADPRMWGEGMLVTRAGLYVQFLSF